MRFVLAIVLCACTRSEPPAAEAPTVTQKRCDQGERVEVAAGGWFSSATGLIVRFDGASHDNYAEGATDLLLSLSFATETATSETWMPSAFAPPVAQEFHGHCVEIVEGSEARVVLNVAPLATAAASCGASKTARLDDYASVTDGARFHVDVRRDPRTGEWLPTPLPKMPHHHASRLAWLNLGEHPSLVASTAMRFDVEIVSHTIEQAGEGRWRAEYRARIVCVIENADGRSNGPTP